MRNQPTNPPTPGGAPPPPPKIWRRLFHATAGSAIPAAALIGQRMPGPRIRGKSPIGTAAFAAAGATAAAILIAAGAIPHHWSLWPAAAIAALTELATIPPDDNLAIPLITGTAMWVMGAAAIPP